MLFSDRRSALVRLSDCVKIGLESCAQSTDEILELYKQHEFSFRRARDIALRAKKHEITDDEAATEREKALSGVPAEVAVEGVGLQGVLHSRSLSTILTCCFVIESYANSYAHYLLSESEITEEHRQKLESSFGHGEKTRTTDKWAILSSIGGPGFERGRSPFQDLVILFHFRDDLVHDKPVQWSLDRAQARYCGRLADPVLGLLTLSDALFGAEVYWALVLELHRSTGVGAEEFHRHYNVQPWFDEERRQGLRELAKRHEQSGVQRK